MTAQIPEDLKLLYGETTRVDTILKERGHTLPRSYIPVLIERIAALKGAMTAQDERERVAAERLDMVHSCDWPEDVADEVLALKAQIARMSAPVNDEEWAVSHWVKAGGSMRGFVDAFIAARAADNGQFDTTQYPSCDAAGEEIK